MGDNTLDDIKIINPAVKKINLGGANVEVAFVPAKVTLDAAQISEGIKNGTMSEYDGSDKLVNMIESICKKSNPGITRDWLLENTSMDMMMEFLEYVTGGSKDLIKTATAGTTEKN